MSVEPPLTETWAELREAGWVGEGAFVDRFAEVAAVRSVARRGLGAARVFDGHRNGLERLLDHRPDTVPAALRDEVAEGRLTIGVWGADPLPAEGAPAVVDDGGRSVSGAKVFCSGAGFVDLAIVLVRRHREAPPTLPVLLDLRDAARVAVDTGWFRAPALHQSLSHHVTFDRVPIVTALGGEGTLTEDPWISGDALRSAGVWAGAADVLATATASASRDGDATSIERAGRASAIVATVDAWLEAGAASVEAEHAGGPRSWPRIAALRLELTDRIRALMQLVAEQGGSRTLATDPFIAEVRDGLDLLLLQHRLDPVARRLGERAREVAL